MYGRGEEMKETKCDKCSEQVEKSTYRTDENKKDLIKRLNIIEGQIRGIKQMILEDRYCDDVLIQVSAVNKALKSLGNNILESHLKTCVATNIQKGNMDILDDVIQIIKKLQ